MKIKHLATAAAVLLLVFLTSSCARKPWQDPLLEKEAKAARALVMQEQQRRSDNCTCCIDAEVTASWDSNLYDGGLMGYLQVLLPSSFKLVAINPLGQPIFALTTDGVRFQTINAVKGVYKHGKVASFVKKHSIPENVLHDDWGKWLTGSMQFKEENLVELRRDETSRGIWITLQKPANSFFSKEFLLFDPQKRELLERVVIDKNGDESARVVYRKWTNVNGCPLPTSIEVEGESYGTTINIALKDILTDVSFDSKTFSLKLPPGYLRQYYP